MWSKVFGHLSMIFQQFSWLKQFVHTVCLLYFCSDTETVHNGHFPTPSTLMSLPEHLQAPASHSVMSSGPPFSTETQISVASSGHSSGSLHWHCVPGSMRSQSTVRWYVYMAIKILVFILWAWRQLIKCIIKDYSYQYYRFHSFTVIHFYIQASNQYWGCTDIILVPLNDM